jgi:hypothetical protein
MNTPTTTTATGDRLAVRRCSQSGLSHWHPPTCHTVTLTPKSRTVPMMVEHWASEIAAHRRANVLIRLAREHVDGVHDVAKRDRMTCLGCGDILDRAALLCRDCMRELREGDDPVDAAGTVGPGRD